MPGLIANDRRANALQIYLSKPLTRVEYVAGKLVTLVLLLSAVTWVPGMLLLLLQILFAGNFTFLRANLFLIPAITLFSAVQVLLSAFAMLALSSLSKSRRFVAMMYAGLIFFTAAMYQALRGMTSSRAWAVISPEDVLDVVGARDLPEPRHARDSDVGGAAGHPRPDGGLAVDSGAAGARRRGGDVIVATEHLSKWYGQVSGLNDVTVTVPPGITGLLGPNGAGKSTFMKLITGQLKPSKGAVRVLGEPIWGNHELYRRIGFCPEQDAFYERMTGLDWVTALVRLNGLGEDEAPRPRRRARSRPWT